MDSAASDIYDTSRITGQKYSYLVSGKKPPLMKDSYRFGGKKIPKEF